MSKPAEPDWMYQPTISLADFLSEFKSTTFLSSLSLSRSTFLSPVRQHKVSFLVYHKSLSNTVVFDQLDQSRSLVDWNPDFLPTSIRESTLKYSNRTRL